MLAKFLLSKDIKCGLYFLAKVRNVAPAFQVHVIVVWLALCHRDYKQHSKSEFEIRDKIRKESLKMDQS